MSLTMDRRQWLRNSALAAAACSVARNRLFGAEGSAADNAETIYLDQNENPYGISKKTQQAVADTVKFANRYPGDETAQLRDLIAEREGVSKDHVVLGAGSTEIFSLAGLLYGSDGKEVLLGEPTYIGFKGYIQRVKGKLNSIPVDDKWEYDLDALARAFSKNVNLVYVCNPNNPTGTIVDGSRLRPFCEDMSRQSMVFVDEAYNDLVDDTRYASMIACSTSSGTVAPIISC